MRRSRALGGTAAHRPRSPFSGDQGKPSPDGNAKTFTMFPHSDPFPLEFAPAYVDLQLLFLIRSESLRAAPPYPPLLARGRDALGRDGDTRTRDPL